MSESITKYWWTFLLRGIIAVLFGIAAMILPGITLGVLVLFLGAFLVADGVVTLFSLFYGRQHRARHWFLMLLEGLAGMLVGVGIFIWPAASTLVIILLVGVWAVITGILEIAAAINLRAFIEHEFLLGLSGLLSILFGVILFIYPQIGGVTMVWVIGIYALLFGVLLIFLGFKLRRLEAEV